MGRPCRWSTLMHALYREAGQDLAEYVLLVGLIAIVAILGLTGLGLVLDAHFRTAIEQLPKIL